MTKLWTIPSLFLATGILVVACSPEGQESPSSADEESIVSQLPLSDGCSACAVDEIGGACEDALDACADDPHCLDPQGCFGSCEANDASCFAACAQASALFDDLVECVVCDACADACQGEWTCGGGDPGDGGEDPECQPGDPNCEDGSEDPGSCPDGTDDCCPDGSADCEGQDPGNCDEGDPNCDPDGSEDPQPCEEGDANCDPGGDPDPGCQDGENCDPDQGGEGSVCLSCVHQADEGECGEVVQACLGEASCNHVVECVHDCGQDAQCAEHCLQEGNNSDLVQQVLGCVLCGPCQDACAVENICG